MKVLIVGAGGHSREVADAVESAGHEIIAFIDDNLSGTHSTTKLPIIRSVDGVVAQGLVVAIGDNALRLSKFQMHRDQFRPLRLVDPSACVSRHAELGDGVQVLHHATVNAATFIGDNVIVNTGSIVSHDAHVGSHTHLAPGTVIGGGAKIGSLCLIGSGAVVLPGVSICDGVTVGAGAVVTRDIDEPSVVVGTPARPIGGSR